jgi:hypothetical protein
MTHKYDKEKYITEFIVKYRFGDKLYKNSRKEVKD